MIVFVDFSSTPCAIWGCESPSQENSLSVFVCTPYSSMLPCGCPLVPRPQPRPAQVSSYISAAQRPWAMKRPSLRLEVGWDQVGFLGDLQPVYGYFDGEKYVLNGMEWMRFHFFLDNPSLTRRTGRRSPQRRSGNSRHWPCFCCHFHRFNRWDRNRPAMSLGPK